MKKPGWRRRLLVTLLTLTVTSIALFVVHGLWPDWRTPESISAVAPTTRRSTSTVRVLAWNVAKAFAYGRGGFDSPDAVEERLDRVAAIIEAHRCDLVLLSEVVWSCGPCPVNQVRYLAEVAEMSALYGDNFRWGFPFFDIRSGNAVLSRLPLRAGRVEQLPGAEPFWQPTNNRRILWFEVQIDRRWWPAASLRNDSFDLDNNLVQVNSILNQATPPGALLAGDFNAEMKNASMQRLRDSGKFTADWNGPPTFPASAPQRQIDFVLAPSTWRLIESRVLETAISDHRPVLSVFEVGED